MQRIEQTYLQIHTPYAFKPFPITVALNGIIKTASAFEYEQQYYIKLRDLADDRINISYDQLHKRPIVQVH